MEKTRTDSQQHLPFSHRAALIGGDLLVILSFIWIGRGSHSLGTLDILAGLTSALPFIIGWFLITPWFGIYKADVCQNWRKLVPRLLIAWAVAVPAGLVLRALFLGRLIPYGILPAFALISMAYIGLVTLIWRSGYIWWVNRKSTKRNTGVSGVEL